MIPILTRTFLSIDLFKLLKSSPLNAADYETPRQSEARGVKRKATEALDKLEENSLNGDLKPPPRSCFVTEYLDNWPHNYLFFSHLAVATSRSKAIRSSSLSLSSSGLWPITNAEQNGEASAEGSDSDDSIEEDSNEMIEQTPGGSSVNEKKEVRYHSI